MVEYSQMLEEMKGVKSRVDRLLLEDILPKTHMIAEVELLYKMMRDYPERGGKGMRPFICVTSCRAFGGSEDEALLTASCLELFQNWILIHDDIEDGSEGRAGPPQEVRLDARPEHRRRPARANVAGPPQEPRDLGRREDA
jgi:geranylgeranyl pyrophosphate synthase